MIFIWMYSYYSEILVHIKKAKIWSLFTAWYPRTSRLEGNFSFFLSVLMIHNTRTVNISMVTFKTLHQIDAQPPVKELTFIQLLKVAAKDHIISLMKLTWYHSNSDVIFLFWHNGTHKQWDEAGDYCICSSHEEWGCVTVSLMQRQRSEDPH